MTEKTWADVLLALAMNASGVSAKTEFSTGLSQVLCALGNVLGLRNARPNKKLNYPEMPILPNL